MLIILKKYAYALLGFLALSALFTPEIHAFNITQYIYPQSKTNNPTLSPSTKALVDETCKDFKIDPKSIKVVRDDSCEGVACTDCSTIWINQEALLKFSTNAQRFLIAHELGHFPHKNPLIDQTLHNVANKRGISLYNVNSWGTQELSPHAMEYRADITAMLKGPRYAMGGIEFFQEVINQNCDFDSPTHPRPSERLNIAQEIETLYSQQGITHAIA